MKPGSIVGDGFGAGLKDVSDGADALLDRFIVRVLPILFFVA